MPLVDCRISGLRLMLFISTGQISVTACQIFIIAAYFFIAACRLFNTARAVGLHMLLHIMILHAASLLLGIQIRIHLKELHKLVVWVEWLKIWHAPVLVNVIPRVWRHFIELKVFASQSLLLLLVCMTRDKALIEGCLLLENHLILHHWVEEGVCGGMVWLKSMGVKAIAREEIGLSCLHHVVAHIASKKILLELLRVQDFLDCRAIHLLTQLLTLKVVWGVLSMFMTFLVWFYLRNTLVLGMYCSLHIHGIKLIALLRCYFS